MSEENKNKDLDDKTNNEILFEVKQMEADYESLKLKMLKDFDELVEIENRFNYANVLLLKRLKKD
jgi:hypothetical protein